MTHEDIYTKFMIEYDKANITSSYPSLTEFEIATILDKAYLALIAQKLTGNNQRKVPFEYDTKAIEDLRPLIVRKLLTLATYALPTAINEKVYATQDDMLYYLNSSIIYKKDTDVNYKINANTKLINHEYADKFKYTDTNHPWIKTPVCYLEGDDVHVLYDPLLLYSSKLLTYGLLNTYIKKPNMFIIYNEQNLKKESDFDSNTKFELSDSMAEELINLAITFTLESVESSRLQSKTSLLSLES